MKKLLYLFILLNFNLCFSQFGVINDLDGFVNVRSSSKKGNNIVDKLENGFIVFSFEPDGNWANINYKKNGKELAGYVYKNKIKYISEFTKVPLKSNDNGIVKLENQNIKIEIAETKFIKEKHNLKFHKNNLHQLDKIDNMQIFGTDGNIPSRQYKSIKIGLKNSTLELPNVALKNLYEPNLENSQANYDKVHDVLYITSSNSDGAGGYEIMWIIENGKYKNRIEAYGF